MNPRGNRATLAEDVPRHLRDTKVLKHLDQVRDAVTESCLKAPVSVELHPTNICNFSCPWCGYRKLEDYYASQRGSRESIAWPVLSRLIDEFHQFGVRAVTISGGGEPLLYPQAGLLLGKLAAHDIRFGVTTNGSTIGDKLIPLLLRGEYVRVSLYKITKEALQDRILSRVADLLHTRQEHNSRCLIGISVLADHDDFEPCAALLRRSHAVGPDFISVRPVEWFDGKVRDWTRTLAAYAELAAEIPNTNLAQLGRRVDEIAQGHVRSYSLCPSIYISSHVAATGDVYPCCEHSANRALSLGNIHDSSFRNIWESERYACLRRSLDARTCPFCRYNLKNIILLHALADGSRDWDAAWDTPHADFL